MTESATVLDELRRAEARYDETVEALSPHEPEAVEELAEQLLEFDRILETYEDRATGSGDFGGYIAFRSTIDSFVEGLPEDLPLRDRFETVANRVDKRRLTTRDFEAAREAVQPVRDLVDRLETHREAATALADTRSAVSEEIAHLADRIRETERLLGFEDIDFDAPLHELQAPIEDYNEAVTADFRSYVDNTTAAAVLDLYALAERYPLVDVSTPPTELHDYVSQTVPDLTVHELLEYSAYSSSKLAHFVDDPQAFRAAVSTERTYLERLTAAPFRIDWPPPPAVELRWQLRERRSLVSRFADDATIAALRTVEDLTRDADWFDRLRAVAVADDQTTAEEREKLQSGIIRDERDRLERTRERLRIALDEAPNPRR